MFGDGSRGGATATNSPLGRPFRAGGPSSRHSVATDRPTRRTVAACGSPKCVPGPKVRRHARCRQLDGARWSGLCELGGRREHAEGGARVGQEQARHAVPRTWHGAAGWAVCAARVAKPGRLVCTCRSASRASAAKRRTRRMKSAVWLLALPLLASADECSPWPQCERRALPAGQCWSDCRWSGCHDDEASFSCGEDGLPGSTTGAWFHWERPEGGVCGWAWQEHYECCRVTACPTPKPTPCPTPQPTPQPTTPPTTLTENPPLLAGVMIAAVVVLLVTFCACRGEPEQRGSPPSPLSSWQHAYVNTPRPYECAPASGITPRTARTECSSAVTAMECPVCHGSFESTAILDHVESCLASSRPSSSAATENATAAEMVKVAAPAASTAATRTEVDEDRAARDPQGESARCLICQDADRNTLFFPCRHICACSPCSDRLDKCPVCRTRIESKTTVYLV